MTQDPRPRSFQQVLGDLEDGLLSRTGLDGLREGGPALDVLESVAQASTRANQDVFSGLNASDPTRLTGEQLDRYGRSRGVRRKPAVPATTPVTVTDTSFLRVASKLSTLTAPPAPGNSTINVQDARLFAASGSVYVGRGTASLEGPLAYTSKVNNGSDWTLVLSGTVARRHDGTEEVVLAQGGDRVIPAGATCTTPQGNALSAATYQVLSPGSRIPDGETTVENVQVACTQPGEVGNVPAGALATWSSPPFSGAAVTNPYPVTNGQNVQKDPEYLVDIQAAEAARARGTPRALESFALGVTSPDEPRTVTSASYVDRVGPEPAVLTIDDGSGYEPIAVGVAREQLVGAALGGERDFELAGRPVVKAQVSTTIPPPWAIQPGTALAFEVGGVITQRQLRPGASTTDPYQLSSDVNSDSTLRWEAVVLDGGQSVAFRARSEFRDDIHCSGTTAGLVDGCTVLGIPTQLQATLFLYLNDQLLHKDGRPAAYASRPFHQWSFLVGPQTIQIDVDGTGPATYTISDGDFAGTGYLTVGRNSPAAWTVALRRRIPGIRPTAAADRVMLTSSLGPDDTASVSVLGGTLVAAGLFSVGGATGYSSDYLLNRATSELEVAVPLSIGDNLGVGSDQTRGFLESTILSPVTFAATATWWIAVDSSAFAKGLGVSAATYFAVTVPADGEAVWGGRARFTAAVGTFSALIVGDYVVFWDPATPATLGGYWTVAQVALDGSWFELDRRQGNSVRYFAASCATGNKIFVCGGYGRSGGSPLRTAEVYDPSTGRWTPAGIMNTARAEHWAVPLPSGDVLVGGGTTGGGYAGAVSAPEIWNHLTNTFIATTTTNAPTAAIGQAADILSGFVYVCGGQVANGTYTNHTSKYDAAGGTWTALANRTLSVARHTFTAFNSVVWSIGGEGGGGTVVGTEYFDPVFGWSAGGNIHIARQGHRTSVTGGTLLAVGGSPDPFPATTKLSSTELLNFPLTTWSAGAAMATARAYHGQAQLSGGKVVAAGGESASAPAEVYNPAGPSWSATGQPMSSPRQHPVMESFGTNSAILAFGQLGTTSSASAELWTLAGGSWAGADPLNTTSFALPSGGASFGSSEDRLRRVQAPPSAPLTATSIQGVLNTPLGQGAMGSYVDRQKTSRLRWRTNTWPAATESDGPSGDIFLAAADTDGQKVGLPHSVLRPSSAGQVAWTMSGNEMVGTPTFAGSYVLGLIPGGMALSWPSTEHPSPSCWLMSSGGAQESWTRTRAGQSRGHYTQVSGRLWDTGVAYLTTRSAPEQGWAPLDRACFASPWALGPYANLVVVANDARTYDVSLFRKLAPTSGTYSVTSDYADATQSPTASLGTSFGVTYDFVDHAIYMRARGKTHAADPTRSVLWRWWRHGKEGERAAITYGAPAAPLAPVGVTVNDTTSPTVVTVGLAGDAEKTGAQVRPSTFVGMAAPVVNTITKVASVVLSVGLSIASAIRFSGTTALVLSLPSGVLDHGIIVGDVIYLQSTDVNFSSGLKTVVSRAGTTLTYSDAAADAGPDVNIGTVSRDLGETRLDTYSPALVAGDWVRISAASSINSSFTANTSRLVGTGPQYLTLHYTGFAGSATTTLQWRQLVNPGYIQVFSNPAQTVTAIVAAAHALYLAGLSPVDPTVLGDGTGTISLTSDDEAAASGTSFALYDGVNAVMAQTTPGVPTDNYSFTLKDPVEPSLAISSDWAHEDVRLVPVSAAHLAAWLQSAATSGMWPGLRADPASRGRKLQLWSAKAGAGAAVQVGGGSANSWTAALRGPSVVAAGDSMVCSIRVADVAGLVSDGWCTVSLTVPADRPAFTSASTLSVLASTGRLSLSSGPSPKLWYPPGSATEYQANLGLVFEQVGDFVRIQDTGLGTNNLDLSSVSEGDWVLLSKPTSPTSVPQMPSSNSGYMRVVRAFEGDPGTQCLWVEYSTQVDTQAVEADLRIFEDGSILPGDRITFGASTWGPGNQTTWTVARLGDAAGTPFADKWTINLDATGRSPVPVNGPVALGTSAPLFRATPATPQRWTKRIRSTVPAGELVRVRLEGSAGWGNINAAHGAILTVRDKLEFSTDVRRGRDAYSYHVGLVGEVNKVLVGDSEDPATYPGVEAAGSKVRVYGPRIRPVAFAVSVRLRQGYAPGDAQAAVRSAIVGSIQSRPHGRPIPISDLIRAASLVVGVDSVAPLSPYSSVNDYIDVQPGERARVLDPKDVSVTVVGN